MPKAKTGRPRGRPRKIIPVGTTLVSSDPKRVEGLEKKKRVRRKKTEEEKFIEKQKREFDNLKVREVNAVSDNTKKLGKIPIIKFKPAVLPTTLPQLVVSDFQMPTFFQPITPPLSDVSRSGSEFSASFSPPAIVSPPPLRLPIQEHVTKFQLINAWLARKQSNWCFKNSDAFRKMKEKESLIATFKCMAKACSYTTISRKNFETHIRCHESSSNQLDFLYFCPYCFFKGSSAQSLLEHYTSSHNHDRFQCAFCFYRSVDSHTSWEHCATHHPELPRTIYECPLEPAPNNEKTKLRLQDNRRRFVLPLHCSSCSINFFLMDEYDSHIRQHISKTDVKGSVINSDFEAYEKRKLNNQIGRYECLFCEYGTNHRGESLS